MECAVTDFPGLTFSEEEGKLLAHLRPHVPRPPLDEAGLRGLIEQAGFGRWFLNPGALATLLARCNAEGGDFDMPIGERRDGSVAVEVAADGLTAWVDLVPAQGGREIALDDITGALTQAEVRHGVDQAALQRACASGRPARVEAARGVPPQNGIDARFELQIELVRDRVPHVNEQGLIDFRELGAIPVVEPGQALLRRVPATAGTDGVDVRGKALPAKPGRDLQFATGLSGVSPDPSDPNLLRAAVKGQPVRVDRGMLVEQVVRRERVDIGSGNIDYDGSVQIDGDVMSGMHVKASGDIIVGGTVDGGILEAGGNVQVAGGIIANARVLAGGGVSARFAEHAQIEAGTSITIEDMVLQCDLQALNQVVIGAKSPRARLVGGSTRAMLLVQVANLAGGLTSNTTRVQVGINPKLDARHHDIVQLVNQRGAEEDKLKKLVQHLVKTGDHEKAERAKLAWRQTAQAWAAALKEKSELEAQLALAAGARIVVTQGASGAADLLFGKKHFALQHSYDAGTFSLLEDKLAFLPAAPRGAAAS